MIIDTGCATTIDLDDYDRFETFESLATEVLRLCWLDGPEFDQLDGTITINVFDEDAERIQTDLDGFLQEKIPALANTCGEEDVLDVGPYYFQCQFNPFETGFGITAYQLNKNIDELLESIYHSIEEDLRDIEDEWQYPFSVHGTCRTNEESIQIAGIPPMRVHSVFPILRPATTERITREKDEKGWIRYKKTVVPPHTEAVLYPLKEPVGMDPRHEKLRQFIQNCTSGRIDMRFEKSFQGDVPPFRLYTEYEDHDWLFDDMFAEFEAKLTKLMDEFDIEYDLEGVDEVFDADGDDGVTFTVQKSVEW